MNAQRLLPVALLGAALRELLPALHRIADALDPAGTATQAWGPREVTTYVPAAWVEMEVGK